MNEWRMQYVSCLVCVYRSNRYIVIEAIQDIEFTFPSVIYIWRVPNFRARVPHMACTRSHYAHANRFELIVRILAVIYLEPRLYQKCILTTAQQSTVNNKKKKKKGETKHNSCICCYFRPVVDRLLSLLPHRILCLRWLSHFVVICFYIYIFFLYFISHSLPTDNAHFNAVSHVATNHQAPFNYGALWSTGESQLIYIYCVLLYILNKIDCKQFSESTRWTRQSRIFFHSLSHRFLSQFLIRNYWEYRSTLSTHSTFLLGQLD